MESGTAFRFKIRQFHNVTREELKTDWSYPKVLTTRVPVDKRLNEYSTLSLRGTGLNNHHASYFKIDDNVMLDHAFFIGLYLAVVDRRDLMLVEHNFYNTSTIEADRFGRIYNFREDSTD